MISFYDFLTASFANADSSVALYMTIFSLIIITAFLEYNYYKIKRNQEDYKKLTHEYKRLHEDDRSIFSNIFSEKDKNTFFIQKLEEEVFDTRRKVMILESGLETIDSELKIIKDILINNGQDYSGTDNNIKNPEVVVSNSKAIKTEIKETDNFVVTEKVTSIYRQVSSEYSHSLKTPLSSIGVAISAISNNIVSLSDRENYGKTELINNLNTLLDRASDSLETIRGILDEGAGFLPVDSKRLSLNSIIHKIIRMCTDITANNCKVSVSLEGVPDFKSNWLCVFLPIMQIVENAFEANSDGGNIWIDGVYREGTIKVLISDDGSPIPQTTKEQIFEYGFSQKGEGRGLGLKIAKRCIEYINGEVFLVQSNEDKTVFCVEFKPELIYE